MMVAAYLTKQKQLIKEFTNNIPWVSSFIKINGLVNRIASKQLDQYFDNLENEFKDVPPSNIWNYYKK